ncbi:hypothetical protein ACPXB3_11890 [Gordonia sp. DT219]|uniref:hypothetical protein n=1 Tax=Gordonia sp. DT219 TaxID=3416658 RepID=UPI003CECF48D
MSSAPNPALPLKTIAAHVAVPFVIGIVMALCYLGGFHKPDPHELRVNVVGDTVATAVTAQELQRDLGDHVDIRTVTSVDEARSAIEHREIAAAFVPDATNPQLLVSTAAGDPTAVMLERIFTQVTVAHQQPLHVVDVVAADPSRDPSGQSLFFFLVALTVGSYGTGIAIAVAAGGRSLRVRAGLAVGAAVLAAGVLTLIAVFGFDALPGAQWQIFGLSIPYALATMLFAIGLHPLIGRFTTLAMVTIFVGLNFTSSGGVFAPELQPRFFAALHDFWIGAGFNEAARDLAYFPQVSLAGPVGKVIGWLIAAAALVVVAGIVERRRQAPAAVPASTGAGRHERSGQQPSTERIPAELTPTQEEELAEEVVA